MSVKPCVKCGAMDRGKDGACRPCIRKYKAEWAKKKYHINPEAGREQARKWRANNPEKAKQISSNQKRKNPEKTRESIRRLRVKNTEKIRAYSVKYREENLEKVKAREAKYHAENPEKIRAYSAKYYAENKEKIKARDKSYTDNISDHYVADRLGIPVKVLRNYPDLIKAKRELIKSHRTLKQIKEQTNAPESK
jgi:hypothetical protein